MSKLMIKGQQASGTYGNASDIKINEISGLTASNAQEALVALNTSLTQRPKFKFVPAGNKRVGPVQDDVMKTATRITAHCYFTSGIRFSGDIRCDISSAFNTVTYIYPDYGYKFVFSLTFNRDTGTVTLADTGSDSLVLEGLSVDYL